MHTDSLDFSRGRKWLLWGVFALAFAGLYAFLLGVGRTPQLANIPFFAKVFHEALVVHVDLSVLVWFLAVAAMFWSASIPQTNRHVLMAERTLWYLFVAGTVLIMLSPLDPTGSALMSNYIPVIQNRVFFLGLSLVLVSVGILAALLVFVRLRLPNDWIQLGSIMAALATLFALAAFAKAYVLIPDVFEGQQYYEQLFWAGGHILQFTHGQMQMLAWILLVIMMVPGERVPVKWFLGLFLFNAVLAFISLVAMMAFDISSMAFRNFYTRMMMEGSGLPLIVVSLWVGLVLMKQKVYARQNRALYASLWMSLLLFALGGFLGLMIQGQNVTIPAHYHGSIVSVTIAFMGLTYMLLPKFGYREVASWKMSFWQPLIYGVGQMMHVIGLAWSGGYGVPRKTPGLDASFDAARTALGLMGAGAGLSVIGGVLFVIVVWRAVRKKQA